MIRNILLASLLLCAVAFAQPPQGPPPGMHEGPGFGGPPFGPHDQHLLPPGRWWKDADVVKNLGLSDAQIQKIETVFQDSRMKLVDVHANLEKEEIKLEPLIQADNPDEGAVLAAIDRITAARASLEKANAQMAFAIRRVLTPEQWKKLRTLRRPRGHFPPPGPGLGGPHGRNHPGEPGQPGTPDAPDAPGSPEGAPAPGSPR